MKKFFTLIAAALMAVTAGAQTLISYSATETLPEGITLGGTTSMAQVKIHTNTDAVNCIKLANGYTTDEEWNGNCIKLAVDGGFLAGDTIKVTGAINNSDETKTASVVLLNYDPQLDKITTYKTFNNFINGRLVADEPTEQYFVLTSDVAELYLCRSGKTAANIIALSVGRPSRTIVWTTTALVSQLGVGGLTDAQRTLNYMSDDTFVVKEAFGEGTSDINLIVNEYGAVDFADVTPGSDYYSWKEVAGCDEITKFCVYGMGYTGYAYTMNNEGEYYKVPTKDGGEFITTYSAYTYKGNDYVGYGSFYVCWGKTRLAGTSDHTGIASLVYTPNEGTEATAGDWKKAENASIGFYYDEMKGDTCYRVNNWYGVEGKSFHFKATDKGYLTFYSSGNYLYTGDATITSLLAYGDNYSYTVGNGTYYVKDLTKVRNGEIGFYAYGYNADGSSATGASNWNKNYYIFSWENEDAEDPSAVNAASANEAAPAIIKTPNYIIKDGVKYNYAGQRIK